MTAFRIHHPLRSAPRWFLPGQGRGDAPATGIRGWLQNAGSLTQRLRTACGGVFSVRVLRQGWSRVYPDEAGQLGVRPNRLALVREVELCCDGIAWVFARTLIPVSSLRGPARRLSLLGSRPLGAVLFADPSVMRGLTQYARLAPGHALYESAAAGLVPAPEFLWGRRTLFYLGGKPLLVNEIFLPGVLLDEEKGHAKS